MSIDEDGAALILADVAERLGETAAWPVGRDALLQEARRLADLAATRPPDHGFWKQLEAAANALGAPAEAERLGWGYAAQRVGWIRAEVSLLAEGGRTKPIRMVYKPHWNLGNVLDGTHYLNIATLVLDDVESLAPGETARGRLFPLVPFDWQKVEVGQVLPMQEASKRVGSALVLEARVVPTSSPPSSDYG